MPVSDIQPLTHVNCDPPILMCMCNFLRKYVYAYRPIGNVHDSIAKLCHQISQVLDGCSKDNGDNSCQAFGTTTYDEEHTQRTNCNIRHDWVTNAYIS